MLSKVLRWILYGKSKPEWLCGHRFCSIVKLEKVLSHTHVSDTVCTLHSQPVGTPGYRHPQMNYRDRGCEAWGIVLRALSLRLPVDKHFVVCTLLSEPINVFRLSARLKAKEITTTHKLNAIVLMGINSGFSGLFYNSRWMDWDIREGLPRVFINTMGNIKFGSSETAPFTTPLLWLHRWEQPQHRGIRRFTWQFA